MQTPIPKNEKQRQAALEDYGILDTEEEAGFDELTQLAAYICEVPAAYISLVDKDRQWLKSQIGMQLKQTPRDIAICAHTIAQEGDLMIVPDTLADQRFKTNPMVTGKPGIRFYAGTQLLSEDGHALGTLCAIDFKPRELSSAQQEALRALGRQAMAQMELRRRHRQLQEEKRRSESLLHSILPKAIAEQLKTNPGTIAQRHDQVTILFSDLVGFTQLASRLSPGQVVTLLNEIFSCFDDLTLAHGAEKIKTIGDAYMVASGLPNPCEDHAARLAHLALDMQNAFAQLEVVRSNDLMLRIGLHSGPVVAGVIGKQKFSYDLWGDAVNIASRMESHGEPGRIQISKFLFNLLGKDFNCQPRGRIHIKGKEPMETFWLEMKTPAKHT